jgi:hypothetical protein
MVVLPARELADLAQRDVVVEPLKTGRTDAPGGAVWARGIGPALADGSLRNAGWWTEASRQPVASRLACW